MARYPSPYWTDEMLLDLIQRKDDRAAFAELYERYWDLLVDIAYKRLKSREIANEIVQDIFVSFFIRRQEITLKSSLEAYLKTAVRNQVFRAYHARQNHHVDLSCLLEKEQIGPALPDELLEAKQLKQKIYLATRKMPEKCRDVFIMSRYEYLSHQDIANELEISVSTVKKHITKALGIVRSEIGPRQWDIIVLLLFISLNG